jgi:hypothetical protein
MMPLVVEAGVGRLPTRVPELAARAQGLPAKVQGLAEGTGRMPRGGLTAKGRGLTA